MGRPKFDFHTGSKHYGPGQQLYLPRDALSEDDVVLVVDDFLASGSCQEAMFRLVARAGARPAGLAVLVEKTFDGGRDFLSAWPVPVASLAAIVLYLAYPGCATVTFSALQLPLLCNL